MKFEELSKISVNGHTENKNGLTYLSWTWAWSEIKKHCPDASYEILRFENNLPYVYDENTGYMVFTKVTINNQTYEMWLPVMDGNNKAMLNHPYTYKVKEYKDGKQTGNYIEKHVEPASMFDINKTIMRCLVKNIAMFGLGIYIYAGEDMPEGYEISKEEAERVIVGYGKYAGKTLKDIIETEKDEKYLMWMVSQENTKQSLKEAISKLLDLPTEEESQQRIQLMSELNDLVAETECDYEALKRHYKVKSNNEMTIAQLQEAVNTLKKRVEE
jgi:pyruvate/2-oxoacid:ferredoxin oxidoreductase alpha subunit